MTDELDMYGLMIQISSSRLHMRSLRFLWASVGCWGDQRAVLMAFVLDLLFPINIQRRNAGSLS